jgi:hypothetical protein
LKIPTIFACLDANRVNNSYNLTILFYKQLWEATTINKFWVKLTFIFLKRYTLPSSDWQL